MPYKNPKTQREAMRRRYRERYHEERGFREEESLRKAKYYATNSKYRKRVIAKAKARKKATGASK